MLVGDAQRFDGSLSDVAGGAVQRHIFAERFRPKLAIPIGEIFEVIRIGHHDAHVFALFHGGHLQNRAHEGGVLCRGRITADVVHIRRTREETVDVDAEHRRGKKPYGAELGKSSAYAVGENIALDSADLVGNLFEIALVGVGGENDVFLDVHARLFEQVEDNEILRHRLAGRARFGNDVEAGLCGVDDV